MRHAKPIHLVLAFVMLFGGWLAPLMAQGQAQAFAVQIAALQSQESAEALVNGLHARELDAYWVKANIPGQGVLYRVRLGKFVSESRARAYAERLRKSGLLDQYFIVTYDPPSKVTASMLSPVMASTSSPDQSRTVSPPSPSAASPPSPAASSSPLGQAERETIILIASRQWAAPAPLSDIARSSPPASPELAAAPPATKQSPSPAVKNAPVPPLSAPPVMASPNGGSSVASAPSSSLSSGGSSAVASADPPSSAISTAVSVSPPEVSPTVSRSTAAPAASSGAAGVSSGASEKLPALQELGPPLLRGVVESRNGQLQLVVQNLDARQSFKGLAQVAVNDGQRQHDTAPVPLVLRPDEERAFPLNAALVNGAYTMMIFDDTGAIRIIRSAPIGAGLPQSKTAGATTSSPPPLPDNDISVVPRQIAATSENITLEFEITSQRPLGYITLTLHVSNTPFPQRAVLTGNQGRIPFLIPTRLPETSFTYELKDENDRVLLTGEDDLRRLAK